MGYVSTLPNVMSKGEWKLPSKKKNGSHTNQSLKAIDTIAQKIIEHDKMCSQKKQVPRILQKAHREFMRLTGVDIEKSIGKIPKDTYFYEKCNQILTKIQFYLPGASISLSYGLCGSGYSNHVLTSLCIKFPSEKIKSLSISDHFDEYNNPEIIINLFVEGVEKSYSNLKTWDCMWGENFVYGPAFMKYETILEYFVSR